MPELSAPGHHLAGHKPAILRPHLRIARTIADLEQSQDIAPQHLSEAINYRSLDRSRQQYQ